MNNRTLSILLIVFLVLVAAATAPSWWPGGGDSPSRVRSLDLSAFTQSGTDRVSMGSKGETPRVLERDGSSWKVNGKPVAATEIKDFFSALSKVADPQLVSKNKANHDKYGVTSSAGNTLVIEADGRSETYYVGRAADVPSTFYIRRSTDDRVYQVSGTLRDEVDQDLKTWQGKSQPAAGAATAQAGAAAPAGAPATAG